jgi:hypothetical protein
VLHLQAIADEIREPSLAITKQYLEMMSVVMVDGLPKVVRVDHGKNDEYVSYYCAIEGDDFFFVAFVSKSKGHVLWVNVQAAYRVYLTCASKTLSFQELSRCLPLSPLRGWSKGDVRRCGKGHYSFSRVSYEPNLCLAYDLEEKLDELLVSLELCASSVKQLAFTEDVYIVVYRRQYSEANMGLGLKSENIKRMAALGVGFDMDAYFSDQQLS